MELFFHNSAGRWSVIVWVFVICQSVILVPDVGADDAPEGSTTRAEATSRSATFDSGGEEAGRASAITCRESADGTRIVQVIEDDKMIRIAQRPGKGVTVIVVETVRDSEKVSRYAAPNLDSLKSRHPRGYEFYQRYANRDPMVADTKGDAKEAVMPSEKQLALEARNRAAMQQQQIQQMQQLLRRQQAQLQQQVGAQQSGGAVSRSGWASGSARAQASARASSSASSSSSSSKRSSSGGR